LIKRDLDFVFENKPKKKKIKGIMNDDTFQQYHKWQDRKKTKKKRLEEQLQSLEIAPPSIDYIPHSPDFPPPDLDNPPGSPFYNPVSP